MIGALVGITIVTRLLAAGPDLAGLQAKLDRIVKSAHGQVGLSLVHIESGTRISIHGERRFPMASVYKLPIAIELLSQIGEGKLTVEHAVPIGSSDIRACCTLSRRHPSGGVTLTVGELLELMIVESDNTAGDAILKLVGGPAVVERRMRTLGFEAINVSRSQGAIAFEMNGVTPPPESEWTLEVQRRLFDEVSPEALRAGRARYTRDDPRDTATPDDMAALLVRLHRGELLPKAGTDWLLKLMARVKTGSGRLKGLLPPDTIVAHKTGTTDVVSNDVGIIALPPDSVIGGHVVLAVFVTNGRPLAMQQTIAQLSAAAFEYFTGKPLPKPQKRKTPPPKRKRRKD
jgi:beta-lactamase class A